MTATVFCDHPRLRLSGGVRFEKDQAGRRSLVFAGPVATVAIPRPKGSDTLLLVTDSASAEARSGLTFFVNGSEAQAETQACLPPHADLVRVYLIGPASWLSRTTVCVRSRALPRDLRPGFRLFAFQFVRLG